MYLLKRKVGIMYDNISGNTGDVAIGISLRKIVKNLKVDYDEVLLNNVDLLKYDTVIIGGGHLLRENSDFFYDKFKLRGANILNSVGVVGNPTDLEYLEDYKYISFRSEGDRKKAGYINKDSRVVPCTTMLLDDLKECPINIKERSIGIHLIPDVFSKEEEELFINWASRLPYNIYFIPITHYNYDYLYMSKLSSKIKNSRILPIMKPLHIFTIVGKFDYFITCSLHGAIFSYTHNVPFILMEQEKSRFFLQDRGLEGYLFRNLGDIISLSEQVINNPLDYSNIIAKDRKILKEHVERIKENVPSGSTAVASKKCDEKYEMAQLNLQNSILQINMYKLSKELEIYKKKVKKVNFKLEEQENKRIYYRKELNKIYKSRGWKVLKKFYLIKDSLTKKIKRSDT
ncbi:polysaccharide pyruvyl transferase family protein [Clostridium felsineum]|uniref:polysaccharide pyruvyl transferase family protein n=1 Tax=Clostridium felsineum TaxID=36839 RepID=UPI003D7FE7B8